MNEKIWYAAMMDPEDWDAGYGSFDHTTTLEMLDEIGGYALVWYNSDGDIINLEEVCS